MADINWTQLSMTTNGRKWTCRMHGKAAGISGVTRSASDADPLKAYNAAKADALKEINRQLANKAKKERKGR